MPANMMIEPVGSSLNVTGSSSATVSEGLMPGRMPTSVPSSTPMAANMRFPGWMATSSPWPSAANSSMTSGHQPLEGSGRQTERQRLREEQVDQRGEDEADRQRLRRQRLPEPARRAGEEPRRREHEAAAQLDDRDQSDQGAEHPAQRRAIAV